MSDDLSTIGSVAVAIEQTVVRNSIGLMRALIGSVFASIAALVVGANIDADHPWPLPIAVMACGGLLLVRSACLSFRVLGDEVKVLNVMRSHTFGVSEVREVVPGRAFLPDYRSVWIGVPAFRLNDGRTIPVLAFHGYKLGLPLEPTAATKERWKVLQDFCTFHDIPLRLEVDDLVMWREI